ncbi:hypothetical protein IV38_GL001908 [Lactobacillus selangorensis]|uniref:Uncharacterized protein n=1 Tax=Lactobacillus selangorensis TaxID=81857 RepID=A0A0R2FZU2_9LACO|nr:hypothetical protein [Lactobacillus selangorensis]KRN27695.1 hypothetical protein IV38_GL001908 [Lactobacillus selangorensis]KRN30340.1 hypothetical protein IV40_GL001929 [Lactobacillus selangorensis]
MNYEIMNVLKPDAADWKEQKERMNRNHTRLITLAPDPTTPKFAKDDYPRIVNIVDYVTGRTYDPNGFLFFDQVQTVDGAEIFMNQDFSIDIKADGNRIGTMRLYPNTRRFVNNITYLNQDGTRDFIEEYAYDGKLFSRIFYDKEQVQEILFFNDEREVVLTYYFYNGQMNYITVQDPKTRVIKERYNNLGNFLATKVAEIVRPEDKAAIYYLGIELTALSYTKSKNTLFMSESALDDSGQVRGNLMSILDDKLPFIQKVVLTLKDAEDLKRLGIESDKIVAK